MNQGKKRTFAYITGSDVDRNVVGSSVQDLDVVGHSNTYRLRSKEPRNYTRVHVTKSFFRQKVRYDLSAQDCVVNLVTDPDQNPKVLHNVVKLLSGYTGMVINHPRAVLETGRDKVASRLRGTPGLIVPEIVRLRSNKPNVILNRIGQGGIRFPAILRAAGTHTGEIAGLVDGPEAIAPLMSRDREYFLISFVDFRSADGLYRKYRVFFIGKSIIFRHLLVSENWNVHAKARDGFMAGRSDLIEEEKRLFERGLPARVMHTLAAIRDRIGLDYFGIDFALTPDETIVLFETNATMNFFPFSEDPVFDYVKACLAPAQAAFDGLLYPEITPLAPARDGGSLPE